VKKLQDVSDLMHVVTGRSATSPMGRVGMAAGKVFTDSARIGEAGMALIRTIVLDMGHVWSEGQGSTDVGIDGSIELRDPRTGVMSGRHVYVQSKARNTPFAGEDEHGFHYLCEQRDLDYWLRYPEPVILVCSHPGAKQAWWVDIQGWFADPGRVGTRRVDFDKITDAFVADAAGRLLSVADPHGAAHTPAAVARNETLTSNLLPVDIPPEYFRAPTRKSVKSVYEAQARSSYPVRDDFVVTGGRISSFAPLSGTALAHVPDAAANRYPTVELADGSDDDKRVLVELLNRSLRQDLAGRCSWHRGREFLYVTAPADLAKETVRSTTGRNRQIFQAYPVKSDPTRIAYYRHAALRWQFLDIDGEWLCAITPDYYFSHDGVHESRYAKQYLRKIKQIDKHLAVLGETRMWVARLREYEGTLDEESRILHFGEPVTFDVNVGIDDSTWKPLREIAGDDASTLNEVDGTVDVDDVV
jgi:hypothetical protein